jgi:mono/diheme cytochrome c family protein
MKQHLVWLILLAPAPLIGQTAGADPPPARSTLAGVYSAGQATRGSDLYALNCQSCHTPASHAGPEFTQKWAGHTLFELFEYIRTSMPKSEPGSLTRREYLLVLAYLLRLNGLPAGREELAPDAEALAKIRIEFKVTGTPTPPR